MLSMATTINFQHDSVEDFNTQYCVPSTKSLNIAQWNIRGMHELQKFDNVALFLDTSVVSIDVIVLGETWLKSSNCSMYSIPKYNAVFSCRESSSGGLAMYIKDTNQYTIIKNEELDGFHLIHVELKSGGLSHDVIGIYRPPSFDYCRFQDILENLLSSCRNKPCFIVGDMNIPINLTNNNVVRRYNSLLESYNFACSNSFITRPVSSNILDHVISKINDLSCVRNDTIYTNLSDHLIVITTFKLHTAKERIVLTKNHINKRQLKTLFSDFLENFECSNDINNSLLNIVNTYNELQSSCTTKKTETVKEKSKHCPWLTFDLWQLIKLKNKYLKKCKFNPNDQYSQDMLKHITKKVEVSKKACKSNYYKQLLDTNNTSKLWKNINEIMGRSKRKSHIELDNNGVKTTNTREVCEVFNNYFATIGSNLAATIPKNSESNTFRYMRQLNHSIFLRPATYNEVYLIINGINSKKSNGPDGFPTSVLKDNIQKFSSILSHMFNQILCSGIYPDCLKMSKVVPIFKSGESNNPCNYRPISTLSVFNKVFEKLLVKRILEFYDKYDVLYKYQYGFRKGCSTSTAIVELVDFLIENIDKKCIVGGLFIDLKKAFDTLDHNILLKKLEYYGIRGVANDIIRSYLIDRQQYVVIDGEKSSPQIFNVGVPQGSNIGPLLFLTYINDIGNLPLIGIPRLFADDTAIFYPHIDVNSVIRDLEQDLHILIKFCNDNLLSINLSKTKYMLFHSPRKKLGNHINPNVGSNTIEKVSSMKYLGLLLDSTLSWENHIKSLEKKVASMCGMVYRVRSFVPRQVLLKFYYACIHSLLQYLVIAWGHACRSKLNKLQVLQNRCLKIIFKLPPLFPTLHLYSDSMHSVLPIRCLCEMQSTLFVYDMLNNQDRHYNLVLPTVNHGHNTRQANNLMQSRASTSFGQTKLSYFGPLKYNRLPEQLKQVRNRTTFKTNLKQYYKDRISEFLL